MSNFLLSVGYLHYNIQILINDIMLECIKQIRGSSQKKCTERNTYRIEHQMCGKLL